VIFLLLCSAFVCDAGDYDPRFVRDYPPGFYGMWWKAERFYEPIDQFARGRNAQPPAELYTWDKRMSELTGIKYPFYPTPFPWDYGTGRTFNLPNYHTNDWR
jgi:hypothetical protein